MEAGQYHGTYFSGEPSREYGEKWFWRLLVHEQYFLILRVKVSRSEPVGISEVEIGGFKLKF